MSWTLCTSGAAVFKAGANANSTVIASGAALSDWSDQAEGKIEMETRRLWVDNYSGLTSGAKNILADVCTSLIAINIINYDMSGYTSRQEAGTMLDVNDDMANRGLKILKDFKSNTLQTP